MSTEFHPKSAANSADPADWAVQSPTSGIRRSPTRLLILEDDPFYAELLVDMLSRQWPKCQMVMVTRETEYRAALVEGGFDLILSDYSLPQFTGLQALALARAMDPEIPFVVVSGSIVDNVGAESLRAGATDYVLKDRIARLVPAVQRALDELEESKHRRHAETARDDSEALKGAIMDAALDCVIVTDEEGRIIEFNPAAEETFGYIFPEVAGELLVDKIFPIRLREEYLAIMQRARRKENGSLNQRIETTGMRADGSEFPIELAIVPIQLKTRLVFTAYLRNITERVQAETKVRQIQAMLEETNRDLTHRNQEIQSFYHTLSHELKTPLTSAREFVSIVMDRLAGPLSPTQAEYLGIAMQSCDQLRVCINDLLDTTRLDTGKLALDLKPTQLSPLLHRTITALSLKAGQKGINLISQVDDNLPPTILDEHRLTQVITNLLNNAIAYTPINGTITVEAVEAPGQPDWVQVCVGDTGRGIPVEEQEHIFERLYQVKSGDATSEHGIGLGLYLCRELVQLHGGSIWVKSAPGQGTQFFFTLPRDQKALQFNVLVMDDEPDVRDMFQCLLETDYNVRVVEDGAAGLREMERHLPDVVIMDLAMPNMNGPQTLKEIRQRWGTAVPVIVYTVNSNGENLLMKQMMEHSPFTLLVKPCNAAQVMETVNRVVRSTDTTIWRRKHRAASQLRPHP